MTPYAYDCPRHGLFQRDFEMGGAPRHTTCAAKRCHHEGVRVYDAALQFTYGKEDFHGPTIGERVEKQLIDNPNAVHVGSRWI